MQDYLFNVKQISPNYKRVQRLQQLMGIMAIYPKRNLSKLGLAKYIRPYLLRGLEINRPNQVWSINITYIPMAKGFMCLVAIIDLYYCTPHFLYHNFLFRNYRTHLKVLIDLSWG